VVHLDIVRYGSRLHKCLLGCLCGTSRCEPDKINQQADVRDRQIGGESTHWGSTDAPQSRVGAVERLASVAVVHWLVATLSSLSPASAFRIQNRESLEPLV
jgi:hypothetical protein